MEGYDSEGKYGGKIAMYAITLGVLIGVGWLTSGGLERILYGKPEPRKFTEDELAEAHRTLPKNWEIVEVADT